MIQDYVTTLGRRVDILYIILSYLSYEGYHIIAKEPGSRNFTRSSRSAPSPIV